MKFSLDRFEAEGRFAICFDEQENKYEFPGHLIPLAPGQLFEAELDPAGLPQNVTPLPEETAARRRELHKKTSALFRRRPKA